MVDRITEIHREREVGEERGEMIHRTVESITKREMQ